MACACKVKQQVSLLEKYYGTKKLPSKKTDISGAVTMFFKKMFLWLLMLPIMPVMFLFTVCRKFFTNKPIRIDKFLKFR